MENTLDWYAEAKSVIESEKSLLKHIEISPLIASNGVYLNIETLENQQYCVLLNHQGFCVVSTVFDQDTGFSQTFYETSFALFSNISKGYSQRFNELVNAKLNEFAGTCEDKKQSKNSILNKMDTNDIRPAVEDQVDSTLDKGKSYVV